METLRSCEVFVDKAGSSHKAGGDGCCWKPCAPLQVARSGARIVALGERYLAAVGGCDDPFGRIQVQDSIELFDVEASSWSLLDTYLARPRTCASVAALDDRRIIIAGGCRPRPGPAEETNAQVEVIWVPSREEVQSVRREGACDADDGSFCSDTLDMLTLAGRMGCATAVVHLPETGSEYPHSNKRCLVTVGGERSDRSEDVELFTKALNLETGKWCESDVLPTSNVPPKTAVTLCVAAGRVAGARLHSRVPGPV
jgi:hypothetical protein